MPATRHSRQQHAQPPLRQVKPPRRLAPLIGASVIAAVVVFAVLVVLLRPEGPPKASGEQPGALQVEATPSPGTSPGAATTARTRPLTSQMGVFQGTSAAGVREFEDYLGYQVRYVVDFSPRDTWGEIASPGHLLDQWRGTDYRLVHAVPMLPRTPPAAKLTAMRAGAQGQYNQYFVTLGRNLVAAGQENAVLRIGWEFNIESWPWGIPQKDAAVYRAFFRQIVKAMRSVEGQKFNINWNVNNAFNPNDGRLYWPGDAWVDSVGVDVYDVDGTVYPYPKRCGAVCREQRQIRAWDEVIFGSDRGLDYWTDFAQRHRKPMTLPEWGLWDRIEDGSGGGDNPFFVRQMHGYITDPRNNVAMAAYFNHEGGDGLHDVTKSFPNAGKVFKQLFKQPAVANS